MRFRILMVCTGNICRSAIAEGILKRMLIDAGEKEVEVYSAGVGAIDGWEASYEAIEACRELQVDITNHRSRFITLELIQSADLILAMTQAHVKQILTSDPSAANKTSLLGRFDSTAKQVEIEDPIGMSLSVYRQCADHIATALKGLFTDLPKLKE